MSRAWSTIRKTANERGCFARQCDIDGRRGYVLVDSNLNVLCATTRGAVIEEAVYSL